MTWAVLSRRRRAVVMTVAYFCGCVAVSTVHRVMTRLDDVAYTADEALSEASGATEAAEEVRSEVEDLRSEVGR